jgi:acetoin utilization protein AcuB
MIARHLISKTVPPIRPVENGHVALEWMEEFKVSHLAVADGTRFVGIISEDMVVDENNLDLPISHYVADLVDTHVAPDQHIYDVIRTLSGHDLSIMPVVDAGGTYIGCITMPDLLTKFDELAVVNQPGGILVVEMDMRDYSLAQVAHIVESNGARILSSYIFHRPDSDKMELTLKIDREDQTSVIQGLERYGYRVAGSFHDSEDTGEIKDRYDALMRYINI